MIEQLFEIIKMYPNISGTVFAAVAATISGIVGYILKRPLQRQALSTELFKAQLAGYESLTTTQAARIAFLEMQTGVQHEYEAVLVRRLRECEERYHELRMQHDSDN